MHTTNRFLNTVLAALMLCAMVGANDVDDSARALGTVVELPVITSASSLTVATGQPFTYTITVTNNPTSCEAVSAVWSGYGSDPAQLYPGITFTRSTRTISGTVTTPGFYDISIQADNAGGRTIKVLTINVTGTAATAAGTLKWNGYSAHGITSGKLPFDASGKGYILSGNTVYGVSSSGNKASCFDWAGNGVLDFVAGNALVYCQTSNAFGGAGLIAQLQMTGTELWHRSSNWPVQEMLIGWASSGLIYARYSDDTGSGIRALSNAGIQQWDCRFPSGSTANNNSAIDANGTIYLGGNAVRAVSSNGSLLWAYPCDAASLSIGKNGVIHVFGMSGGNSLLTTLSTNGIPQWTVSLSGLTNAFDPIVCPDGSVLAVTHSATAPRNTLYCVSSTGSVVWQEESNGIPSSAPICGADGTIYYAIGGGQSASDSGIYALNTSGQQRWFYPNTSPVFLTMMPDGTLLLHSMINGWSQVLAIGTGSTGLANSPWPMTGANPQQTRQSTASAPQNPSIAITSASGAMTVAVGKTVQLSAATTNFSGTDTYTWSSSDTTKATVNSAGLVTGIAAGTATITARGSASSVASSVTLTVTAAAVPSVSITVPGNVTSLAVAATLQLSATTANITGTESYTWTSGDATKATVSAAGLLTGVAPGSVTITALGATSGASKTITLTVTQTAVPVVTVTAANNATAVTIGATLQLSAATSNITGTESYLWTSGNTAVATVDSNGLVTGVTAGTAVITAKGSTSSATGTLSLSVTAAATPDTGTVKVEVIAADTVITSGETLSVDVKVSGVSTGNPILDALTGNTGQTLPAGCKLYVVLVMGNDALWAPTYTTQLAAFKDPAVGGTWNVFSLPVLPMIHESLRGLQVTWIAGILDSNLDVVGSLSQVTTRIE